MSRTMEQRGSCGHPARQITVELFRKYIVLSICSRKQVLQTVFRCCKGYRIGSGKRHLQVAPLFIYSLSKFAREGTTISTELTDVLRWPGATRRHVH